MRIYRMFFIPFVAAVCLCSTGIAATSQRVLSAAISAATATDTGVQNHTTTTHSKNTSVSTTMSRTAIAPGVKSRAATSENNIPDRKLNASRTAITRVAPVTTQTAHNAVAVRASTKSVSNRNANATRPTVSARATTNTTTAPNAALQSMLDTADANSRCLESYTQCMDNYCNVLDADLGRCSCSGEINQFSKISDALSATNVELQDVMKKISYIGLSADEITSMYTQTAAESIMGTIQDTSQTKSDLEAIKGMLVDVKNQSNTSVSANNDISGLLNLDLTQGNNFDASSILGSIGATNSSPLNNQRGEQLYKSAAARCKSSVLKNCIDADSDAVESQYQTEISRACTAYSKALQEKNDAARRMISNAERVLQMARLKVQSEKDSYDLSGCVAALDSCMRDDFVCGSDYGHCLDATGRYFVSGQLVSGASESAIMTGIWGVADPGGDASFIKSNATGGNIANLIAKIGNPIHGNGLCSSVLNKCQSQWRNGKSDSYDTMNKVVLAWLGNVIPKIVVRQRELINDFRGDCVSTVSACMAKQAMPAGIKPRDIHLVVGDFLSVYIGACRTQIDMCMSATNLTEKQILAEYIQKNICSGYDSENDVCVSDDSVFRITTTKMAANANFSFKMSAAGRFTVNWGDGKVDEIVRNNTTEDTYSHTYESGGVRTIIISGAATGYSTGNTTAAISFYETTNYSHLKIAAISGSLGAIFPTLGTANGSQPKFYRTFCVCSRLTSIPSNLFRGVSGAASYRFAQTFYGCTGLTSIPSDLFSKVSGAATNMFYQTFYGCTGLTSIPYDLFKGVSGAAASMFYQTFYGCTGLTSIPSDLFSKVSGAAASMFYQTFYGCNGLTSLPPGLFSDVSGAATNMFLGTFENCIGLKCEIPLGFFGNPSGAPARYMFKKTFNGCTNLTGPTARMADGTPLYDIMYNNKTWYELASTIFEDMYTGTKVSDD